MEQDTVNEPMEFYYITYSGQDVCGAIIAPQHKIAGGGKNPDGFNIASATQYLYSMFGFPVIIMSWRRTTRKRRDEFETFVKGITAGPKMGGIQKKHLTLVSTNKGEEK